MSSYGMWLSASGMKVSELRQTVLANNMANASTTGFKADLAVVVQRRVESESSPGGYGYSHPVLDGLTGGVHVRPTNHNFAQGFIEQTGRPLDVAIRGEGFFTVSDGSVTRYTRDGEFARSDSGELVLASGGGRWKVLSEGGAPISFTDDGRAISIGGDGTVRQGDTIVSKLGIVEASEKDELRKVGENLFEAGDAQMTARDAVLVPGAREESNFKVMQGLASMIEASRAYQINATLIQLQDQATGQLVSRVARVG